MAKTLDFGRRIELYSMDRHCQNMSIALYERHVDGTPTYLVHTYSSASGAPDRVAFVRQSLLIMLGMEPAAEAPWLHFPCHDVHEKALNRAFLDLCKLESSTALAPKPLTAYDKKAECDLTVESLGQGCYRVISPSGAVKGPNRAEALVRGFVKLCDLTQDSSNPTSFNFACHTSHDAMVAQLMYRAQNVRASMQEQEQAAGRGLLSAPSQQT